MPHEYTVDSERHVAYIRVWGALTPGEMQTMVDELAGDPRISGEVAKLIDLRKLTSVAAISSKDVRAIASAALSPASRRALVTADSAAFGLARMFAAFRTLRDSREQVGVFRTLKEAEDWLGLTAT
jgi:hypothetical protein